MVRQAIAQIQNGLSSAVKTLSDIMEDKESPASARVTAARSMIDMAIRAIEIEELDARLTVLEAHIKERNRK